jgi:hypothetical protein
MKVTMPLLEEKMEHINAALNKAIEVGGMEVVIQKHVKKRTNGQNRYQWTAILGDISRQVRIDGKGFTPVIWHEHLKGLFLPDEASEELTLPDYVKWAEMPDGTLKMVGSTAKLTTMGMSIYFEQLYAYAVTELDVRFTANV